MKMIPPIIIIILSLTLIYSIFTLERYNNTINNQNSIIDIQIEENKQLKDIVAKQEIIISQNKIIVEEGERVRQGLQKEIEILEKNIENLEGKLLGGK